MIAIKDMEMPKNCASCIMRVGKCKERIYTENRPDHCPLTEIKTDGDTISRQAAMSELDRLPTFVDNAGEPLISKTFAKIGIDLLPSVQPEPCEDAISRQAAIDEANAWLLDCLGVQKQNRSCELIRRLEDLPSAQPKTMSVTLDVQKITKHKSDFSDLPTAEPERKWIPVTLETLPNPNSVVVVCGKKGTWDYGTYRGWYGDIHSWWWKKNTIKHVYWWMYKTDALPEPYKEEGKL